MNDVEIAHDVELSISNAMQSLGGDASMARLKRLIRPFICAEHVKESIAVQLARRAARDWVEARCMWHATEGRLRHPTPQLITRATNVILSASMIGEDDIEDLEEFDSLDS